MYASTLLFYGKEHSALIRKMSHYNIVILDYRGNS